jgi:hypothetical protein
MNNLLYGGFFGKLLQQESPVWPPQLDQIVVVHNPVYKELFVGKVLKNIWNDTAAVLVLLNNKNYVEKSLITQKISDDDRFKGGKGLFLLLPVYAWKYVDKNIMDQIITASSPNLVHNINVNVQDKYSSFINALDKRDSLPGVGSKKQIVAIDVETGEQIKPPVTQNDIDGKIFEDRDANLSENEKSRKNTGCSLDDDFKDTSLLTDKGDLDLNDLFREKDVNHILFDSREKFNAPSTSIKNALLAKLKNPENIDEEDKKIIVNKTVAIRNMITTKEDEMNEGKKIVSWITENLVQHKSKLFADLKMSVFNGYVHLARKGLRVDDIISQELVPHLTYFKWQYGVPIDYDTLKYVLFQNDFQKTLVRNSAEQVEAEKILSKEYLICLQPEPKYQMWVVKRLLMCWYADNDLQNNIRKIKILVNQWRGREDQGVNKQYGVMPSIVVYPRYGRLSARIVLSRLAEYFLLYQNIAWKCSKPTYFIKISDLIWYTNGTIDLKLYFRKTKKEYKTAIKNDVFDENYSVIKGVQDVMYPYLIA